MIEDADNHTIRLLQEIRTKIEDMEAKAVARDDKTQAQIGTLSETLVRQTKRIDSLTDVVTAMRDDIRTLAIAVDHHSSRLDRIEQHLGLDAQKH